MPKNEMTFEDSPELYTKSGLKKVLAIVMVAIIVGTLLLSFNAMAKTVPAGNTGVLLNWGEATTTLSSGFHWISPVGQEIALVNTQTQSATAEESAASSDLQEVTTSVTVNYQVDPLFALEVYTTLRNQYESRVILPAMQDALKASTAKYQATQLITQREAAKNTFQTLLQEKLTQYHIIITSISITDFQFSESFTTAIEAKVTAEQNALAAQNQLQVVNFTAQQQIIQATANATALVLQSQGQANATIIAANATATQIQLINAQLAQSPNFIQYLYAIGWDGKLPVYWASGNSTAPYLLISPASPIPTPTPQPTNTTQP